MKSKIPVNLNILIKKEDDYFSAHCLEFDLVATDDTLVGVQKAITELCRTHIEFTLRYNNHQNLFSPAPLEVWTEYYTATEKDSCDLREDKISIPEKNKTFILHEIVCHA